MSTTSEPSRPDSSGAPRAAPAIALAPWPPGVRGFLGIVVLGSAVALRLSADLAGLGPQRAYPTPPVLKVDPNTAPAHVLEALPQIGPSLASRIVGERQTGPFASLDALRRRVRGLGPATMEKLARHLRLEGEAGEARARDTRGATSSRRGQLADRRRQPPAVR